MDLRDWISQYNEEALTADGLDGAIIGMCERSGTPSVVAYDRDKCIEILAKQFDYSDPDLDGHDAAEEYFDFNVAGAYVGENTPVFITFALHLGNSGFG
jgi:hypothetical protein